MTHSIRLRGPWQKQVGQEPVVRIRVPETDVSDEGRTHEAAEEVTYERRFNRPTGIEAGTILRLKVDGASGRLVELRLNGESVACSGMPVSVDITTLIQPHNAVEVVLAPQGDRPPRLSGEVTIEIED